MPHSTLFMLTGGVLAGAQYLPATTLHRRSVPKAEVTPNSGFHSHNDFWREYPIISALKAGCIGIEADVWVYGDELFVGHSRDALAPQRTFTTLYVEPLVRLLEDKNMGCLFI